MTHAHHPTRTSSRRGFTLIEVLVVLAIIAILAMIAVPSMHDRIVRGQIVEATRLVDEVVKKPVAAYWGVHAEMPVDNDAASLPVADKIVSNLVASVTVEDGAVHITFGNDASGAIKGRTLTLRPAVVADTPAVPPSWYCAGGGKVPDKMSLQGRDRTDIENRYLPVNCRRTEPS